MPIWFHALSLARIQTGGNAFFGSFTDWIPIDLTDRLAVSKKE